MSSFRAAAGSGPDWLSACNACLEGLGPLPPASNLGFVYASDRLAHGLDLVARRLAEATGIEHWVGTGGSDVCALGRDTGGADSIAILTAALPPESFALFDGLPGDPVDGRAHAASAAQPVAIVHGDPRQLGAPEQIRRLAAASGAFLAGGLTSAFGNGALQIAGAPTEGGLSGVLFDADLPILTGLSQGCTPIGPVHEVTAIDGPWIVTIDGRPALEVLKAEIGDVLARQVERITDFIYAARPEGAAEGADYMVRALDNIDTLRGRITVDDDLRRGDPIMFVKRDPTAARADLGRLARTLKRQAEGQRIAAGLYHSCIARGPSMFGSIAAELGVIEAELGSLPLAGFCTNGEIFGDRLYGYAGVLTLFLEPGP
jgi:small ligand-binding sensory domain FIST